MRASLAKEFPEVRTSTTFSDEYLLAVMSMPDSKNPQVRGTMSVHLLLCLMAHTVGCMYVWCKQQTRSFATAREKLAVSLAFRREYGVNRIKVPDLQPVLKCSSLLVHTHYHQLHHALWQM